MKYPFPRPAKYKLRVQKSKTGHGLFAEESIPKNRFVIEYWGDIITNDEANRVGGRYLFGLDNGTTIKGTKRENIARYVNHSCRPNCEARMVGNRIFITTIKNILPGDELTYNYGKEYFSSFITKSGCLCPPCTKKKAKQNLSL